MWWRMLWIVSLLAAGVAAGGCASLGGLGGSEDSPVRVFLRLDAERARPGEAVIAEVFLVNHGEEALQLPVLNHRNVKFFTVDGATGEWVEVQPVYTEREDASRVDVLAAGGMWSRRFVFTTLTGDAGETVLVSSYGSPPGPGLEEGVYTSSRAVSTAIAGARAFERDINGIILEGEAVRVAREAAQMGEAAASAQLIINEAGFLDWLVRFEAAEAFAGGDVLVNPYLGRVRRTAPAGTVAVTPPPSNIFPVYKRDRVESTWTGAEP